MYRDRGATAVTHNRVTDHALAAVYGTGSTVKSAWKDTPRVVLGRHFCFTRVTGLPRRRLLHLCQHVQQYKHHFEPGTKVRFEPMHGRHSWRLDVQGFDTGGGLP